MATFGAIVGLRTPGTRVANIGTTAKTLPMFTARWAAMLDGADSPSILTMAEVFANPTLVSGAE